MRRFTPQELDRLAALHGAGKPTNAADLALLLKGLIGLHPDQLRKLARTQGRWDMPADQFRAVYRALQQHDAGLDHRRTANLVQVLGGILAGLPARPDWDEVRDALYELTRKLGREASPHPGAVAAWERANAVLSELCHGRLSGDREQRVHGNTLSHIEEAMRLGQVPPPPGYRHPFVVYNEQYEAGAPERARVMAAFDRWLSDRQEGTAGPFEGYAERPTPAPAPGMARRDPAARTPPPAAPAPAPQPAGPPEELRPWLRDIHPEAQQALVQAHQIGQQHRQEAAGLHAQRADLERARAQETDTAAESRLNREHRRLGRQIEAVEARARQTGHEALFGHFESEAPGEMGVTPHALGNLRPRKAVVENAQEAVAWLNRLLHGPAHEPVSKDVILRRGEGLLGRARYLEGQTVKDMQGVMRRWAANLALPPDADVGDVVHEMGHHLERENPEVLEAALAFARHRFRMPNGQQEPFIDLHRVAPKMGYTPGEELGRADRFHALYRGETPDKPYYVGKVYKDNQGRITGTELVSSGLESMYRDPARFHAVDPEYFRFILGILRGAT
jgi:hypothetical protein